MNVLATIRHSLQFTTVGSDKPDLLEPLMHQTRTHGVIHIWSARYADLDQFYPLLSTLTCPDEATRAAGFIKPHDTRRYMLRHGMTRAVLGHYTQQEPAMVRFIRGTTGKPDLDPDAHGYDLRFSLSHTDERVCLGISRKSRIGIDMVKIDSRYPFLASGEYLFSRDERNWIVQAAPEDRPYRFFRIWCLKEALIKATGRNVNLMKEADVSGIMTVPFLDGFYTVNLGNMDQKWYIHESGCGPDHHCTLATLPGTPEEPDPWNS